jgi:hypothetical protein
MEYHRRIQEKTRGEVRAVKIFTVESESNNESVMKWFDEVGEGENGILVYPN